MRNQVLKYSIFMSKRIYIFFKSPTFKFYILYLLLSLGLQFLGIPHLRRGLPRHVGQPK